MDFGFFFFYFRAWVKGLIGPGFGLLRSRWCRAKQSQIVHMHATIGRKGMYGYRFGTLLCHTKIVAQQMFKQMSLEGLHEGSL